MQLDKAEELRQEWEVKGNPPCEHPKTDREYIRGMNTGDTVCTTCGAITHVMGRPVNPRNPEQG